MAILGFLKNNVGNIAGTAINLAGNIIGGIENAKTYKDVLGNLGRREQDATDLYNRRYNEDATQRADAQRLITMTEDAIKNRNKQASGVAAVMGGSEESVAAAKAANNAAIADAVSQINAQEAARKDAIESDYLSRKDALEDSMNKMKLGKAESTAKAIAGVSDAAGNLLMGGQKAKTETTA